MELTVTIAKIGKKNAKGLPIVIRAGHDVNI
jgi:hypothetical protein